MLVHKNKTQWPTYLKYLFAGLTIISVIINLQVGYWVFIADVYREGFTFHNVYFTTLYMLVMCALGSGILGRQNLFERFLLAASGLNTFCCFGSMIITLRMIGKYYFRIKEFGPWLGDFGVHLGWTLTCFGVSACCFMTLIYYRYFNDRRAVDI